MKKIISFCLYGNNPLYVDGASINIEYAKKCYPGWICRIYCDQDSVNVETLENLKKKRSRDNLKKKRI